MPQWVGEVARGLNHIQDVTSLEKNPSLLGLERRPCFYSFHEKLPGPVKEGAMGCGFLDWLSVVKRILG